MFTNIGKKIKCLARLLCTLGILFSLGRGILIIFEACTKGTVTPPLSTHAFYDVASACWHGVLHMVLGFLGSWTGSMSLYGLGQLITTTEDNNRLLSIIAAREVNKDL